MCQNKVGRKLAASLNHDELEKISRCKQRSEPDENKMSDSAITDEITVFAVPCFNENQMSDNAITKSLLSRCHAS
jgi:hypothetical protein